MNKSEVNIKRQKRVKSQKPELEKSVAENIIFAFSCILIAYPAFFRGLYFTGELLITHIVTFAIFIAWWIIKMKNKEPLLAAKPLDYCFLSLLIAYLISSFFAINIRGAVEELLKIANYFFVYLLVANILKNKKQACILLNVILFSALGIAVLGLGTLAGSWWINGAVNDGRIHSTLQYANSLASYLTAAFFISIGLKEEVSAGLKKVYPVASFLFITTIILTYSRGGWLIVVVLIILYIIIMNHKKRSDIVAFLVFITLLALICSIFLGIASEQRRSALFWLIILSGTGLTLLFPILHKAMMSRRVKIIAIASITVIIMITGSMTWLYITQKLAEPMTIVNYLDEPQAEKLYEERIAVMPSNEYNLSMELLATGYEKQPFGWRVRVIGLKDNGRMATLLNIRGNRLGIWEKREFAFKTPEDISRIIVQIVNAYPGIELTARNIYLFDGKIKHMLNFVGHRILPEALYSRMVSFSWNDNAVQERFRFFQDALAIIGDYPFFGLGGQGWQSRYFQYQSVAYFSKEIHNHFLRVWVDAGIIAFLSFIGLILSFLLSCLRIIRIKGNNDINIIILSSGFAFLAIVGHSIYDLNLSLGAISISLAALMGLVRSLDRNSYMEKERCGRWKLNVLAGLSLILLTISLVLYIGHNLHMKGREKLEQNNIAEAVYYLERAVRLDPYNAKVRMDLAAAYENSARLNDNSNLFENVQSELRKVINLDRYHPRSSLIYGQFLLRRQHFDEGLDYLRKSLELNPRFSRAYITYARNCINIAVNHYFLGEREKAFSFLERIFEAEIKLGEYIPDSHALALYTGQAHFMLGNMERARAHLEKALGIYADRASASMTLAALYAKFGNKEKERYHFNNGLFWDPDSHRIYDVLIQ